MPKLNPLEEQALILGRKPEFKALKVELSDDLHERIAKLLESASPEQARAWHNMVYRRYFEALDAASKKGKEGKAKPKRASAASAE